MDYPILTNLQCGEYDVPVGNCNLSYRYGLFDALVQFAHMLFTGRSVNTLVNEELTKYRKRIVNVNISHEEARAEYINAINALKLIALANLRNL